MILHLPTLYRCLWYLWIFKKLKRPTIWNGGSNDEYPLCKLLFVYNYNNPWNVTYMQTLLYYILHYICGVSNILWPSCILYGWTKHFHGSWEKDREREHTLRERGEHFHSLLVFDSSSRFFALVSSLEPQGYHDHLRAARSVEGTKICTSMPLWWGCFAMKHTMHAMPLAKPLNRFDFT